MGPKNAESLLEGHSSPVLSRELGVAHWGSGTFFSTFGDDTRLGYITEILSPKWSPCRGSTTSPTPKKFRVEKSADKVMTPVFWDQKGLLLLEFMPQKTIITGQTYANTITTVRDHQREKARKALSRRAAPSWQCASAHVCKISSCHSAMWVPTAKSPTLQSRPSSLGLFSIPSYEKISSG